jgi:hypothetical protein
LLLFGRYADDWRPAVEDEDRFVARDHYILRVSRIDLSFSASMQAINQCI